MRLIPIANPPNRFLKSEVEYRDDEAPPTIDYEVFEDSTREIIASNDSPDVGFRFSVNPYRGCLHACAYCLDGDTPILMADASARPLRDLRVGDEIIGTEMRGSYRRYRRTKVLRHWRTTKPAYRITLEDGTTLVASADHRFLSARGWKYVTGTQSGRARRPHLLVGQKLMGIGKTTSPLAESSRYRRGYLCGMIRGDASIGLYEYGGRRRPGRDTQYRFRLALVDQEALDRTHRYLAAIGVRTTEREFSSATATRKSLRAIYTSARGHVRRIQEEIEWPQELDDEWQRGFLAGIFDAEGSRSQHVLRITNSDAILLDHALNALKTFGFDAVLEGPRTRGRLKPMFSIRLRRGLSEQARFIQITDPAIRRKREVAGIAIKSGAKLRITSIVSLGLTLPMFDITTGTGDFIANGVVSHNCFARPTHEYLGLHAGTDFDRKIVVKPRAPELLREAFERKSWTGETLVFSGVTDCYQPLEATYRLTRGCLEVCVEYRNPVGIITKSALIERDLDLLVALHRDARVSVAISIPFWSAERARAIEPYTPTPARRMRAVERLAKAGIPVGVMMGPLIPGLCEDEIAPVLDAAKSAGARFASFVVLRLNGSVRPVFEERIRQAMPLRAERILARTREVHGGQVNDSRFGMRQRGQGEYAETLGRLFTTHAKRLGLIAREWDTPSTTTTFRRPTKSGDQLPLL